LLKVCPSTGGGTLWHETTAQADLAREHGQKYVDSVNKALIIVSEDLEEYGEQSKTGKNATMDEDQPAADTTVARKPPLAPSRPGSLAN
jgi:hypothetical protein